MREPEGDGEEPTASTSLYNSLGVPVSATEGEIRRAYKRLALSLHPDRCPSEGAAELFHRVHAAYEVLRDRRQRAEYDKSLISMFCVEEYLRRFADLALTAQGLSLPLEQEGAEQPQCKPQTLRWAGS